MDEKSCGNIGDTDYLEKIKKPDVFCLEMIIISHGVSPRKDAGKCLCYKMI